MEILETLTVIVTGHTGKELLRISGTSVSALQRVADSHHANGDAVIRADYTSDGTRQGIGKGRVVSVRERGKWITY